MEQKSERLYTSAPLEKEIDLETKITKKTNDVNSFIISINSIKEKITYFKDKNHKSEKRYKKYKTLTIILKSVNSIVIFGTISTSVTLSITGLGFV